MHALVDASSGIPISYVITPANIADMDVAESLIQKMMNDYNEEIRPRYYMMGSAWCSSSNTTLPRASPLASLSFAISSNTVHILPSHFANEL